MKVFIYLKETLVSNGNQVKLGCDMSVQKFNANSETLYDVAIVGGGIAGSCMTAMLSKTDVKAILIDPNKILPVDFRCEKFDRGQMACIEAMGISEKIYSAATSNENIWIARKGKLVNKMRYPHYGFSYERVINAIREYLEKPTQFLAGKVKSIEPQEKTQKLVLSDGSTIEAKLVILSNGLNPNLRKQLNAEQIILSKNHEMAIGFDIEPIEQGQFEFDSLTYWPEKQSEKMAYFTIFKSGDVFRVNTFGYWNKTDPIMQGFVKAPEETLAKLMPNLEGMIGKFKVISHVRVRPVDLYQNYPSKTCDGVVFIGDAYATSCPGAGTGTTKAMNDVNVLCEKYIPDWLEADKIDARMIDAFYQDEDKKSGDASSLNAAYFLRSISTDKSLIWGARRWMRFFYHVGKSKIAKLPIKKAA